MRLLAPAAVICSMLLASAAAFADDDGTAPPGGITATPGITLSHVLAMHRIATGKLTPSSAPTRVETWTYKDGGQSGTQTIAYSGKDFREDTVLGALHSANGQLGGKMWEQDRNGLTRTISGVHDRDAIDVYALAHALSPASGVELLGQVTAPVHAYVVKVAPKGGRVEYVFYDTSTFNVVRDERAVWGRRLVRTYDDFRTTNGLREAWHIHQTNGLPKDDLDWQMQTLVLGGTVPPSQIAIPESRDPVALSAPRVTLPAKFSGDRIVLTVQIGTHKVNFLMDSGASDILLNRDVADATGVKSFGEKTEVTAGQYLASDALIPKIDFGVASMESVSAETAPYAEWSYGDVPIAGLMGYDFIGGSVIHVDYVHKSVEAISPSAFTPPAGAIALPIRLDDGVPTIEAAIGSAHAQNFVIDTGADRSMIFSGFALAHPSDVSDQGLGDEISTSLPFSNSIYGVGGKVRVREVRVSSLSFGAIRLPDWLFDVSQDAASFEGDDYDGLIGQDVLRNFDLYFDYPRSMVYLVPNERYRQRWGS